MISSTEQDSIDHVRYHSEMRVAELCGLLFLPRDLYCVDSMCMRLLDE